MMCARHPISTKLIPLLLTLVVAAACNTLRDAEGVDLEGGGDAGVDSGSDGGPDISTDLPEDAPVDASDDVPQDAGDDADAPVDTPVDAPEDADEDVAEDPMDDVVEDVVDDPVEDVVEDMPPQFPRVPGAVADWQFLEGSGDTTDNSGTLSGLDLDLTGAYRWLPGRPGIAHVGFARMMTTNPATELYDALTSSQAMTVEAWVRPGRPGQGGPSRIVSYSIDASERNFTLGQEGDNIVWRVRAEMTGINGTPAFEVSNQIADEVVHLVVTQQSDGTIVVYRDGAEVGSGTMGLITSWDPAAHIVVGNERVSRRPFVGEFYRAAIYDRALDASEVSQNYIAGPHERGRDERPRLRFRSTLESGSEGSTVSVPIELSSTLAGPLQVPFVLTRPGVGVPLEDHAGSVGSGGLGTIDVSTINVVGQTGPRTAIAHLISTDAYTTSGETIASIDISNDDLSLNETPLLWFKSDFVDFTPEEYVQLWRNATGGRNALVQGGPRVLDGVLGGRKAMEMDGDGDFFDLDDGFADWSAGMTAFVVADPAADADAIDEHLFDFANSPSEDKIALVRDNDTCDLLLVVIDESGGISTLAAPGAFCNGPTLFAVSIGPGSNPTATLYIDGTEVNSGQVNTLSTRSRTVNLLANGAGTDDDRFEGYLAEVLIYDRELSASDRSQVMAYLLGRYGL